MWNYCFSSAHGMPRLWARLRPTSPFVPCFALKVYYSFELMIYDHGIKEVKHTGHVLLANDIGIMYW